MSRSIGKSGLSETYRSAYARYPNFQNHVVLVTAKFALNYRQMVTILRNGPRILAACESVRCDIERERARQEMATEDIR